MFCSNCGNNIPNGGNVCPYCGKTVAGAGGMAYQRRPARIDNIFTALIHERTPGAIWEFSLWCTVCVCVILSLVAMISVNSWMRDFSLICRMVWLFVMLFEMGTGVLMAFRRKAVMLYVSAGMIQLFTTIFLYAVCAFMYTEIRGVVPVGMMVIFVFLLMTGLGLVVCGSIHFFTRIDLGKITAILDVVVAGFMFIFSIVLGTSSGSVNNWIIGRTGFGIGVTSLVIMNVVIAVFYMLFFFGCIDNRKNKIVNYDRDSGNIDMQKKSFMPGVQCIRGQYQGQVMYLQGHELTFGSKAASAAIVIPSPYISHKHCSVRYNSSMGMYEIMDVSTNGTYVMIQNGSTQRLPSGSYIPCSRGSVISMGSMEQQFRLL